MTPTTTHHGFYKSAHEADLFTIATNSSPAQAAEYADTALEAVAEVLRNADKVPLSPHMAWLLEQAVQSARAAMAAADHLPPPNHSADSGKQQAH